MYLKCIFKQSYNPYVAERAYLPLLISEIIQASCFLVCFDRMTTPSSAQRDTVQRH